MEILFIVGSLREGSFNRMIADQAMKDLAGKAEVRFLDWHEIPMLNADWNYPFPESVNIVRNAIHDADALWIFCPEYNGSYPGGLKNLLDYASLTFKAGDYASGTPIMGKPVAISGAGGGFGTSRAQGKLIELLTQLRCQVMEEDRVMIKLPKSAFSDGVWDMTDEDKAAIAKEANAFLTFAKDHLDK
ncbi:MAG: NAD(P)H-dependent oxidoreductase [Ileibacterium sp.]|nr:NAD(P)H-dependent oxidoreductase [Ileibacterium sp.]